MDVNYMSDYGTGSSSNSSPSSISSWPSLGASSLLHLRSAELRDSKGHRAASFQNLIAGRCTLDDIMREFQMNGSDTPLDTFGDNIWSSQTDQLIGMGPSSAYVRQKSWPEPDSSPAPRLPRPAAAAAAPATAAADWPPAPSSCDFRSNQDFDTSTPINDVAASHPPQSSPSPSPLPSACTSPTAEQWRVLNSLPNAVLFPLLQRLEQSRGEAERRPRRYNECRFCKNNGERESYYRSHTLKDTSGRVTCPVLRAFVCKRCGASGDTAHTSKYCPLSTADERMKSAAMMRSVRLASGRRRYSLPAACACACAGDSADEHYVMFGETTPSAILDNNIYNSYLVTPPLDPSWAALEQKLLL